MRAVAAVFGIVILIAGAVPAIVAWLKGLPIDKGVTLAALAVGGVILWAASAVGPDVAGPAAHMDADDSKDGESHTE